MKKANNPVLLLIIAFIAGFLAVMTFHQVALWLLNIIGLTTKSPYAMKSTMPLGVPTVLSLAFWGGIWGIILAIAISFRQGFNYWLSALILGAMAPSLVSWFIVMPLKGEPVGGGWELPGLATALIVNGAWGLGTALFIRLLSRNLLANSRNNSSAVRQEEGETMRR
ncbi:MAG: hypothetical protein ACRC1Z_01845 [Waterburya sp.]